MPVFNNILAGAAASGGASADYKIERSVRFDSTKLTQDFTENISSYTVSLWVKRSDLGRLQMVWDCGTKLIAFVADDRLALFNGSSYSHSTSVHRDPSAWMHLVLSVNSGTATLYHNNTAIIENVSSMDLTGGAVIGEYSQGSYNFGGYIAEVHFVDGQALSPTDFGEVDSDTGAWNPKRYSGTYGTYGSHLDFSNNSSAAALGNDAAGSNNWTVSSNIVAENALTLPGVLFDGSGDHIECADDTDLTFGSNDFTIEFFVKPKSFSGLGSLVQKYSGTASTSTIWMATDTNGKVNFYVYYDAGSASTITASHSLTLNKWSHVACVRDGTTLRLYIDGVQRGSSSTIGSEAAIDSSTPLRIGEDSEGNYDFNGVISNVRIVNGTCLYTNGTNFTVPTAPLTNVTNTKLLCCQSSTSVTAAAVTPNNLQPGGNPVATEESDSSSDNDSLLDSPTNYEADSGNNGGNYATWNPLTLQKDNSTASLSDGNLELDISTTGYASVVSTVATGTSGKYYCEISFSGTRPSSTNIDYIGVVPVSSYSLFDSNNNNADLMRALHALSITASTTKVQQCKGTGSNNPNTDWVNSQGIQTGDVVGIGIDCDTGILTFYKNGTSLGTYPHRLQPNESYLVFVTDWGNTGTQVSSFILNAGQRPFNFSPPSGFKSLCTTNLADPLIKNASDYFDTKLYAGTNNTKTISGLGFSPDFVWIKARSTNTSHNVFDTIRGEGASLITNGNNAEYVDNTTTITDFNSDGYDLNDPGGGWSVNKSGETYVSWNWDAGDAANPTSISAGSLNSSLYNSSQTWSTYGTQSGDQYTATAGTYVWADVFDNLSDNPQDVGYCVYGPNNKWTFTNPISVSSSVALAVWGLGTVTLNEGESDAVTLHSGGQFYNTISTTSLAGATLKNIKLDVGTAVYLFSVHIDGARLVDPNIAPSSTPSIASSVRANPSAGFSIVSYTGDGNPSGTIGHGLNATPEFIMVKNRDDSEDGRVYHVKTDAANPEQYYLNLFAHESGNYGSYARSNAGAVWNDKKPNHGVFSVGTENNVNATDDYIAYCWTSVEGYSKAFSFVGSGGYNNPHPYIYLGFRPKLIIMKCSTSARDWAIYDTSRDPINPADNLLEPNKNSQQNESTNNEFEIHSNGFVFTGNSRIGEINGSGDTYVGFAWAENPFKYARAR